MLSREMYKQVLSKLNMGIFPRSFGMPYQTPIFDFDSMIDLIQSSNGINSIFISSNGYRGNYDNGKFTIKKIVYGDLFSDFDDNKKQENTLRDARNLSKYLSDREINHTVIYSGGHGFHVHIILKPTILSYYKDEIQYTNNIIYGVQRKIKDLLGLTTMDERVMGTPLKLTRPPYTEYMKRGFKNGNKVSIIPNNILHDYTMSEIITYVKDPKFVIPKHEFDGKTIYDVIDMVGYDDKYTKTYQRAVINHKDILMDDEIVNEFMQYVELKRPCVYNDMMTINPLHITRIQFALLFKSVFGKNIELCNYIWEVVGNRVGYVDMNNRNYRISQIESILYNDNYNGNIGCKKMQNEGICIGLKNCIMRRGQLKWKTQKTISEIQ